ncbi:MAG: GAF domain-containing protein [Anaerolineae bacterium]|nr:GAF domain-containing protein [Anaerolineae bacterium]
MLPSASTPAKDDALPPLTGEQHELCADFALALAQTTERDELARLVIRTGLERLRAQRALLFSYDPILTLVPDLSGQGVPESALATARWPRDLPPFMEQAIRSSRPVAWTAIDTPLDTAARDFARRAKTPPPGPSPTTRSVRERLNDNEALSAVCVPLLAGGELGGLAVFHDAYPRAWTPADLSLARRLGQLAGAAIKTARRFEREKRRRRVAEGLAEVAQSISASLDLESILGSTARYAAELLAAPIAGLIVLDQAIATAPSAHYGPAAYASLWADCQRVMQQAGWLEFLATGEVISLVNTATEKTAGEWFRERGIVSLLLAPLIAEGRLVAMLGVAYTDSPHRFSKPEIDLVRQFAQQTVIAVANADQFRRQRRRADQMKSLAEVSAALSSTLDLDKVLRIILDQLGSVVQFDAAAIEQIQDNTLLVIADSGAGPAGSAPLRINLRENYLARQVLEERRPIVLGDAPRHPDFIRTDRRVRSWIGAPLLVGDQAIGLLVVDSYQPDRYNEEDGAVVAQFARQAALAIERAQLFAAERAGRRQAALLLQMTRAVSASLDLDEVLNRAARDIAAAANVIHCGVYLVDPHRPRLALRGSAGRAPRATLVRPALLQSLTSLGEPIILDPVSDGRLERSVAKPMGLVSLLAVPFIHRDRLVGVALAAAYDRPVTFEKEHLDLAQGIATSAAVAIENARLYQDQERRVNQLAALNEIGQAAAALLKQDQIVELVYQQTARVLNTENFYIALLDEDRDELYFGVDLGVDHGIPDQGSRLKRGEGLTWHVVATREPLYVRTGYNEACERLGIRPVGKPSRSWLGVPLLAGGRALGAMVIQDYERDDAYSEEDIAVLTTMANQAAIALENARLFGEVRQRVQQLIGITSVGAAIVEERDVDRVLSIVADHVRGLTEAEHVLISLLSEDSHTLDVRMAVGPRADLLYEMPIPVEGSLAGLALTTRHPQFSPNAMDDPRVHAPNLTRSGARNLMIVPLVTQERVLGVITAINKRGGPFGQDDMETVQVMSNLAAVAFENARLYNLTGQRSLELKALNEIGQRISRSLSLDTVLEAIVMAAVQLLDAEKSVLFLLEDERLAARASFGLDDEGGQVRFEARDSTAGYVARTGFPVIIHDVAQDGRVVRDMGNVEGIRSLVEVPIRTWASWWRCVGGGRHFGPMRLVTAMPSCSARWPTRLRLPSRTPASIPRRVSWQCWKSVTVWHAKSTTAWRRGSPASSTNSTPLSWR